MQTKGSGGIPRGPTRLALPTVESGEVILVQVGACKGSGALADIFSSMIYLQIDRFYFTMCRSLHPCPGCSWADAQEVNKAGDKHRTAHSDSGLTHLQQL